MSIKMNDIDNTKLEEAMQVYIDGQDKEKLIQLVFALQNTKLFVPAMAVPKKGGFQPYIIKNSEGDMYMPAFTSMKKFPQDQKYQGMLKLQYKQCVSMLLDNPTLVQGIALNPFSDNLMLKTQMLELSRKVEQQVKETQPKAYKVKPDDFRMVVRHNVEFHQIPEQLYEKKAEFIHSLSEETLCEMYKKPYKDMGQEKQFTYTADHFEIMELNISEDINIMQIITPSQYLYQTNCREIYIIWNPKTEQTGYYVIEKESQEADSRFFLDEIREDGSWEKLEEAPKEGNVMSRIMELFGGEV